jgi:hypothetical protein
MSIVDDSETQPQGSEPNRRKAYKAHSTPVLFIAVEYASGRMEQRAFRSRFSPKFMKRDYHPDARGRSHHIDRVLDATNQARHLLLPGLIYLEWFLWMAWQGDVHHIIELYERLRQRQVRG